MAMMAKMRSLAPAFIITVGALFVLFMIISDSNVLEALGGRTNTIGVINGDEITYQQFQEMVDLQVQNQKAQTGEDIDEEFMGQFRDQVWDAVVTQTLVQQEIEKFGITVSDDEIRDIILGPNPPQILRQNFIDSTGSFNRQAYESAITNPQNRNAMIQAEEMVRQTRLSEKLQSLLLATINVSEAEIKNKFIEQNTELNAQFALVDLNLFPDSTIKVTDEEMKEYYNNNLNLYRTVEQRKLRYVLFPNTASREDSNRIIENLENVKATLLSDTTKFREFVDIYSSVPYSKDTLALSAFSGEATDLISKAEPGSVVGPVTTTEGIALYKLSGTVPSNETLVRASHILINQYGSDERNLEEAMKIYDQLNAGVSFERIAKEKSADPGSGSRGGDLGWFGKGAMVPEFEKASYSGEVGVIQKPVKTSFGYHIIKVTGKSNKKYIVEKIVNPIKASASTIDERYNAAEDFSYLAKKDNFDNEAKTSNYTILETPPFTKEAFSVPGIGANKRIVDFAFENDLNDISDPFKVQNGYVVVQISEEIKEAIKPFDEVKSLIQPVVLREKKMEKAKNLAEELRTKINGDLSKVSSINSKVTVNSTGSFKPSNPTIPFVGRDNAFLINALELDINKLSEPVRGNRGYYLIKVTERSKFDSTAYEIQRSSIRDNLLQEKKNSYLTQWITTLKNEAEIVDNRHLFYGQ